VSRARRVIPLVVGALVGLVCLAGAGRVGAQEIRAEVIGELVEHRMTSGPQLQRELGFAFGAAVWAPVLSWIELRGQLLGGALAAKTTATDDRRFGELDLSATVVPFDWLAFEVGGGSRAFTGPLGRQRWVTMRAGSELRLAFLDGRVHGMIGGALIPVVAVSGVESPSVAVLGRTGISYRHRDLSAAIVYEIERYDFPAEGASRRLEQVSSVAARVGVRVPEFSWPW
jgi:hypothetical protein